jgi:hypothetical protein
MQYFLLEKYKDSYLTHIHRSLKKEGGERRVWKQSSRGNKTIMQQQPTNFSGKHLFNRTEQKMVLDCWTFAALCVGVCVCVRLGRVFFRKGY